MVSAFSAEAFETKAPGNAAISLEMIEEGSFGGVFVSGFGCAIDNGLT
jgi:hypothetical protein